MSLDQMIRKKKGSRRSMNSRLAWATHQVQAPSRLYKKTLSLFSLAKLNKGDQNKRKMKKKREKDKKRQKVMPSIQSFPEP